MKKFIATLSAALIACTMIAPTTVYADEWVKTDNGYVYEYDDGTTAEKGWLTIGKDKYYIQKDGTRKTGWLKTTSSKYYFGKDGKMYKSKWLKLKDGTKYFLRSNGKAAVDCTIKISGKSYSFDEEGKLITSTSTSTKKTTSKSDKNTTNKKNSTSKKNDSSSSSSGNVNFVNNNKSSSSSSSTSKTIYVTDTGKRYHYDRNCNGGTYYPATFDTVRKRGLTPCNKCVN